jgi:hypothetical protein
MLVLLLAGCTSVPSQAADDASEIPGVALQDEAPSEDVGVERSGPQPVGFGDYAMTVPKNIVWWPWKIIGGTGKGFVDGIGAGFDDNRMPVLGLIFSPVNAVMGLVTGLGTGIVSEPGVIGPRTNFGRTMGLPTQRPTPIWWLPD